MARTSALCLTFKLLHFTSTCSIARDIIGCHSRLRMLTQVQLTNRLTPNACLFSVFFIYRILKANHDRVKAKQEKKKIKQEKKKQ